MEITFDFAKINTDVKKVVTSPKKFFSKDVDRDWKETLSYFLILSAVGLILTMAYLIFIYPLIIKNFPVLRPEGDFETSLMTLAPFAIYSYVLGIFFSFFYGGGLYALSRLFKLEGDFNKAYKTITYARTLVYLLSWVPVVNLLVWTHSLYLLYVAIKSAYKTTNKTAASLIFSGVIVVFVISSFFLYLSSII